MPEQQIFAGKAAFLEFLELYFIFFHENLHTDVKLQLPKMWAWFSKKIFFRPKMPEICWKNRFLAFSRDFVISFSWFFCTQMRIRNAQKMVESDFREKFFFGRKCRKSLFLQIFIGLFPWFRCFFTQKHYLQ